MGKQHTPAHAHVKGPLLTPTLKETHSIVYYHAADVL